MVLFSTLIQKLFNVDSRRQSGPYFLKPGCRTYLLDRAPDSNPERYKSRCVLTSFDTEGRSEIDVDTFLLPQPTDAGSSNKLKVSEETRKVPELPAEKTETYVTSDFLST